MIVKPVISEKAVALQETGVYVFEVPRQAGKIEVKKAVALQFGVKVDKVNVLVAKGKTTKFKRTIGSRPDVKKAMVKLVKGQKIDLFEAKASGKEESKKEKAKEVKK